MLTTKEAAELLEVKPSTIHKYVREKKLNPVYDSNWQIDATKLFFREDIEGIKKELIKPGITTGEAAELLGLHVATISQYIQKGILKAEKKPYRGRDIYFITPEAIETFKSNYELSRKKEQKEFFDKETGFAWFQSFKDKKGNNGHRILLDESSEPYLYTTDGRKIVLNRIELEGYVPISPISDIDYIHKRGYAKFKFKESNTFYYIVELFYKYLGPKSIKIIINEENSVHVEVKPILINEMLNEEVIQELNECVIEGSIIQRLDGIYIDSDLESITVAIPSELKALIKTQAEISNQTMEEVVLQLLKEKFHYS